MTQNARTVPAVAHQVEQVRSLARRVASFDKAAKSLIDIFVPEGSVVTIRRGGAIGLRWQRMHAYSHRIWMGLYEPLVQRVMAEELRRGDVLWDIGSGPGFFSLLGRRLVGPRGAVVCVDPIPANIEATRAQFELNEMAPAALIQAAAAEGEGVEELVIPPRLGRSFLANIEWQASDAAYRAATDRLQVPTLSANSLLREHPAPTLIKLDVEGAEDRVLRGCGEILSLDVPPRFLIEAHSAALAVECRRALGAAGYRFHEIEPPQQGETAVQHLFADHPGNPSPRAR